MRGKTDTLRREKETKTTIADKMMERKIEDKRGRYIVSNSRLDDLSTYEKIAFYKLVSRKELEGIADEDPRRRQVKEAVKEEKKR